MNVSAGSRPGGWVPGVGWVTEVRALADGDVFFSVSMVSGATEKFLMNEGWRQVRYASLPVIVTRWADGEVPTEPAALAYWHDLSVDGRVVCNHLAERFGGECGRTDGVWTPLVRAGGEQ